MPLHSPGNSLVSDDTPSTLSTLGNYRTVGIRGTFQTINVISPVQVGSLGRFGGLVKSTALGHGGSIAYLLSKTPDSFPQSPETFLSSCRLESRFSLWINQVLAILKIVRCREVWLPLL